MSKLLEAIDLVKNYAIGSVEVRVLRGVHVAVEEGEFLSVMGPSGCGKSTLLHLLGGIEQPTSGRVLLNGSDLGSLDDTARTLVRRRQIGFVFQKMNLLPALTAVENVALPLRIDGISPSDARKRAQSALETVAMLPRATHFPHELSGGEQQRVAIARALVIDPTVILADEPTGALDSRNGQQVVELLRQCVERGRTVVVVTHDAGVARQTDRLLVMRDGLIVENVARGDLARFDFQGQEAVRP